MLQVERLCIYFPTKLKIRQATLNSTTSAANIPTAGIVDARQACSGFPHRPMYFSGTIQHMKADNDAIASEKFGNFLKNDINRKIKINPAMIVMKIPLSKHFMRVPSALNS